MHAYETHNHSHLSQTTKSKQQPAISSYCSSNSFLCLFSCMGLWDFSGITTISHNALARVSVSQRAKHKGRVTSSCSRGLGCALEPKGSDARLSPRLHRILLISPTAVDWNDFDPRSHPQKPASQGLIRHPTLTPQQLVCVPSEASVDKICYGN